MIIFVEKLERKILKFVKITKFKMTELIYQNVKKCSDFCKNLI